MPLPSVALGLTNPMNHIFSCKGYDSLSYAHFFRSHIIILHPQQCREILQGKRLAKEEEGQWRILRNFWAPAECSYSLERKISNCCSYNSVSCNVSNAIACKSFREATSLQNNATVLLWMWVPRFKTHVYIYTYGKPWIRKSSTAAVENKQPGFSGLRLLPAASSWFIHFQTPDEPQSQTKVQENMTITGNCGVEIKPVDCSGMRCGRLEVDAGADCLGPNALVSGFLRGAA